MCRVGSGMERIGRRELGSADQRVPGAAPELVHLQIVLMVVVGDVEAARPPVVGWEGDRGHPGVAARAVVFDQPVDIEEWPCQKAVVGDDPHRTALLDYVEPRVLPRRLGEVDGLAQLRDPLQGDELRPESTALLNGDAHRRRRDRDEGSNEGLDPATAQGGPHVRVVGEACPRY